jgi:hypothetical protein
MDVLVGRRGYGLAGRADCVADDMLIFRRASEIARHSIKYKTPVCDLLKPIGWELPKHAEPPKDLTANELATWVRNNAQEQ